MKAGRDFKSRFFVAIIILAFNQLLLISIIMSKPSSDSCEELDNIRSAVEKKDPVVREAGPIEKERMVREAGPIDMSWFDDTAFEDKPKELEHPNKKDQQAQKKANYPRTDDDIPDAQKDRNLEVAQQNPQNLPGELPQGSVDWNGFNRTEIKNFRIGLPLCRKMVLNKTRVSTHLYTSQKNVPLHSGLTFFQSNLTVKIMRGTFQYLPRHVHFPRKPYQTCSVVGNGGILTGSGCGNEINAADHVFRYGLLLEQENVSAFVQAVAMYPANAVIYTHPFDQKRYRKPVYRAHKAMRGSEQVVRWSHPDFLRAADSFWKKAFHLTEPRITSGLLVTTIALAMCEETHLFGFWPYRTAQDGRVLAYHYFERPISSKHELVWDEAEMFRLAVLTNRHHKMGGEFTVLRSLHTKGVLRLHVEKCEQRS
ncbi:ST8SIA6 [Branchiostoma lanceolatum]|uniref:ST8SIA6 protein n=1 Tax=Branchiostoma lanceolatum TaxID=7740 RepID=A0A8K0AEB3_BRALA|nr:ST8SIA6 [Branchiostoma lanceolatum]